MHAQCLFTEKSNDTEAQRIKSPPFNLPMASPLRGELGRGKAGCGTGGDLLTTKYQDACAEHIPDSCALNSNRFWIPQPRPDISLTSGWFGEDRPRGAFATVFSCMVAHAVGCVSFHNFTWSKLTLHSLFLFLPSKNAATICNHLDQFFAQNTKNLETTSSRRLHHPRA